MEPTEIPEWEAEDLLSGRLASGLEMADSAQAKAMLEHVRFELPPVVDSKDMAGYAAARRIPLATEHDLDLDRFGYYLVELPLTILIPGRLRLVRLRLSIRMDAATDEPVVAHDLFPRDDWSEIEHDIGRVGLDIGKALTFVRPPVGPALGLELSFPLRWKTCRVSVSCVDRLSNPVEWNVTDESINHGFTAYLIARAPKGSPVTLHTRLACELREPPGPRVLSIRAVSGYPFSHPDDWAGFFAAGAGYNVTAAAGRSWRDR